MRQSRSAVFAGVVLLLCTVPARGTVQRTFVSHSGLDSNPCSVDLPCRSFAAAIAQTNASGEVVAVDSAGYGPVTITQAATIVAPLGVHAGISVFSGDGVRINAVSSDVVVLRNLYINSQGGMNGITLNTAYKLYVEHCVVSGFTSYDINLVPASIADVAINDTVAREGLAGVYADSGNPLTVSIDHCRMESNGVGVLADRARVSIFNSTADFNNGAGCRARGTGGAASMVIESSTLNGNGDGVRVDTGSTATVHNSAAANIINDYRVSGGKISIDNCITGAQGIGINISAGEASVTACTLADSSTGVLVSLGSIVRLTRNTITRNVTGINNLGTVHSTGDNMVEGNATDTSGNAITPASKV